MKLASVCLIAVLLTATSVEATTVLALRFANEIAIAADSRLIVRSTGEATTGCKIKNFGDVVVANLGRFVLAHELFPEVAEAIKPNGATPAVDRIRLFTQKAAMRFQAHPGQGSETEVVGDQTEPVAFVFGFFENGRPVVEVQTLKDGLVVRRDTGVGFVQSGQRSLIERIPEPTIQALYHEVGVGPALDLLIRLQARVSPGVMGPVDVIRLTADGANWLHRKPECREHE